MSKKLENAQNLYLKGIRDGDLDAVEKYSGDQYTQHSTGVLDGVDGFKNFFVNFLTAEIFRFSFDPCDFIQAAWVS